MCSQYGLESAKLARLAHELLSLSSRFLQTCIVFWARWHSYTACSECTGLLCQQC
jgi:hypothetical protein